MTINLIDTVRTNRANIKATPMELYGPNGKVEWETFQKALYNWSVTDTDEARDAAFAAGRVIMAHFNEELEDGRKIKWKRIRRGRQRVKRSRNKKQSKNPLRLKRQPESQTLIGRAIYGLRASLSA